MSIEVDDSLVVMDDGQMQVVEGSDLDIPDWFPGDVPLPGSGGPSLSATYNDGAVMSLIFAMADASEEVCTSYLAEFVDAGFEESARFSNDGEYSGLYSNDAYDVIVGCGLAGGVTLQVSAAQS